MGFYFGTKFKHGQIWLVNFDPISSQTSKQTELDMLLRKDPQNRFMTDSLFKIKQISVFDKRRFIKLVGIVNEEIMEKVKENINRVI